MKRNPRIQPRGYSREFTPSRTGVRYMLDNIPPGFWRQIRATARRQGLSVRGLVLGLLAIWLADPGRQALVRYERLKGKP